ncbi:DUF3472 domain-containing protein [Planctomycetota bacterium]
MKKAHILLVFVFAYSLFPLQEVVATEWSVPVQGNAFQTAPKPSGRAFRRNRAIQWDDSNSVFSVHLHVDRQAEIFLKLKGSVSDGASTLRVTTGAASFDVTLESSEPRLYDIGRITIPAGYVRIDLQGVDLEKGKPVELHDIVVVSDTADLKIDYVKNNKGNMFYWGRRGPSVHLRYEVPKDLPIHYAYSELTVPTGEDPIGSYFMANGFGEGYFGMQVNGPDERRVLFSVWSPFKTDNPRDIPKDQRIEALARGPDVHIGEFGNEGSGGQSYLVYPWKAGTTYRFLTEVKPDGMGNTIYASWFGDKSANEWRLIARFRRPKTDTHLRGFHSFLESFSPTYGHVGRRARYGNVWVRDVSGDWHECTRARFSVDATGRGRHRLDFTGGSEGQHFFLRNCGFFSETGQPGKVFTRKTTEQDRPTIDFDSLPQR